MRSSLGRLTSFSTAALLTGLLTLAASSAYAQGAKAPAPAKAATKPAAAAPAAPAADKKAAAAPAAKKDAKAAAPDAKAAAPAAPAAKKDEKVAAKDDKKAPKLTDKQKKDAASKSFKDGEAAFEKGDFQAALDAYKAADEMLPGINPKYKIAVSLDKLNKAKDAVAAYDTFLAYVDAQSKENKKFDPKKYEEKVADAKTRTEALKKTPGTLKVVVAADSAPNLMVAADGQAAVPAKELSLAPGKHTLVYSAEGFLPSAPQDVEIAFAETKDAPAPMLEKKPEPVAVVEPPPPPPPPPPAPPPPPPPPPKSYVPAYVTLGLAGVGGVVGTIFGVSALGAKSDFEASPTVDNADRTDRNALIADMSFAVAITFGVTGAVLLFGGDDKPADPKAAFVIRKPVIAPFVSPTGGGAAASFRF